MDWLNEFLLVSLLYGAVFGPFLWGALAIVFLVLYLIRKKLGKTYKGLKIAFIIFAVLCGISVTMFIVFSSGMISFM